MPTVTIGLPTYNRGEYLYDTIRNILGQTYPDFELIISDDASIDNTREVVEGISDNRIRYHRNAKNLGIPGNLNVILRKAGGEYIIFLHDHDVFRADLIERLLAVYRKDPDLGFVHPGIAWIDPDGGNKTELLCDYEEISDGKQLVEEILMGDGFSCPVTACSLVSRKAYEAVRFFYDESFGFISDVDLWLRLSARFRVGYVREPLISCRRREKGHAFSGVNWKLVEWSVGIHKENIDRVYAGDPGRHRQALDFLRKKKEKLIFRTVLAAGANGNLESFREGINKMRRESTGASMALGVILEKLSFCYPAIIHVGSAARNVMKRRRGFARRHV